MPDEVRVVLLTQDHCKLCEHAKEVLDRVAGDFPLAVEKIELHGERGRDMAAAGGVMFPPGILVEGELFGYGRLSERKLRKELARRAALH